MGFPGLVYCSGLPFPFPGDFPGDLSDSGIAPRSPALQTDTLPLSHQGRARQLLPSVLKIHLVPVVPQSPWDISLTKRWRLTFLLMVLAETLHPTPVLLPWKSHGWRSLVGCSSWDLEESDMTERLPFHFSLSCIGEGNGNPLQCSCLENPSGYGVAQSRTRLKRLSSSSSSRRLYGLPRWHQW